jgi:hypothetical protein
LAPDNSLKKFPGQKQLKETMAWKKIFRINEDMLTGSSPRYHTCWYKNLPSDHLLRVSRKKPVPEMAALLQMKLY